MKRNTRLFVARFLAALTVLAAGPTASAESSFEYPAPAWSTGPLIQAEVVIENVYYYKTAEYTPNIRFWPDDVSRQPDFSSPEMAMRTFVHAMASGDYALWLSCWTLEDRNEMIAKNAEKGRDAEFWIDVWSRGFEKYDAFELTQRNETLGMVMLVYTKKVAPGVEGEDFVRSMVFVEDDAGGWRATNALWDDAVYMYATEPGRRVRRVGRKLDN